VRPLAIGTSLMFFQQVTGQPSVLYYASQIFEDAGFAAGAEANGISVLLGVFKLLMTGAARALVRAAEVSYIRPLRLRSHRPPDPAICEQEVGTLQAVPTSTGSSLSRDGCLVIVRSFFSGVETCGQGRAARLLSMCLRG